MGNVYVKELDRKPHPFRVWSFFEHPKHECLFQTPSLQGGVAHRAFDIVFRGGI